jgi:hypothetical protein
MPTQDFYHCQLYKLFTDYLKENKKVPIKMLKTLTLHFVYIIFALRKESEHPNGVWFKIKQS